MASHSKVFLPQKSHRQSQPGRLSPWGCKSQTRLKRLTLSYHLKEHMHSEMFGCNVSCMTCMHCANQQQTVGTQAILSNSKFILIDGNCRSDRGWLCYHMDVGREKIISGKMELQKNPKSKCGPYPTIVQAYINTNPLSDGNYSNIFHSCVSTVFPSLVVISISLVLCNNKRHYLRKN